jgi:hypothetical protein
MPLHTKPSSKKQQEKRTAAWREEVHREALGALERARAPDASWRKRRDEARARTDELRSWLGRKS